MSSSGLWAARFNAFVLGTGIVLVVARFPAAKVPGQVDCLRTSSELSSRTSHSGRSSTNMMYRSRHAKAHYEREGDAKAANAWLLLRYNTRRVSGVLPSSRGWWSQDMMSRGGSLTFDSVLLGDFDADRIK